MLNLGDLIADDFRLLIERLADEHDGVKFGADVIPILEVTLLGGDEAECLEQVSPASPSIVRLVTSLVLGLVEFAELLIELGERGGHVIGSGR